MFIVKNLSYCDLWKLSFAPLLARVKVIKTCYKIIWTLVLPGQVIDGGSKGWKLDQQDHYGEVEECIQVCASIPGCAGFLYMIDYDYCEFRHEQKKDFIFFDESDIEESDKYMSVLLKDECKTKIILF